MADLTELYESIINFPWEGWHPTRAGCYLSGRLASALEAGFRYMNTKLSLNRSTELPQGPTLLLASPQGRLLFQLALCQPL